MQFTYKISIKKYLKLEQNGIFRLIFAKALHSESFDVETFKNTNISHLKIF